MSVAVTSTFTRWGRGKSQAGTLGANASGVEAPAAGGPATDALPSASGMLTCDGPIANIVTELDTRPGYRVDQLVGLGLSRGDARAESNSAQNTAAISHYLARVLTR